MNSGLLGRIGAMDNFFTKARCFPEMLFTNRSTVNQNMDIFNSVKGVVLSKHYFIRRSFSNHITFFLETSGNSLFYCNKL